MLTVEPLAYARARQAELRSAAGHARLARLARADLRPASADRPARLRRLPSRLQLKPAAPATCCC